jgi:ethanolamine ammonia-lyase large subunit
MLQGGIRDCRFKKGFRTTPSSSWRRDPQSPNLVFQSIAGTEKANSSFGVTLALLAEARSAPGRSPAGRWATT